VNDEKNYAIFDELSKKNNTISVSYVNDVKNDDERDKVYINVKPKKVDDVCFIDTWGLTEDMPQAYIVSKHDNNKKIRQICEIMKIKI
jgi:hypothetical protein